MHPLRVLLALLSAALGPFLCSPPPAAASTPAAPARTPQERPSNGGVLSGAVASIDYQTGLLVLAERGRRIDVLVLPSTSVQARSGGYHSIAEVVRGSRVEIFTSVVAGKYTAQIIKLR